MLRSEKPVRVRAIRERFEQMSSAVLVNYQGMNVAEVSALRDVFRAKGIDYWVVKNTLVRQALKEAEVPWADQLADALKGMTGIAWSYEEPSSAARVIRDFRKENKKLQVKAGVLDGQVLPAEAVESQLASLPNKDEARAMLLAQMMAPAQRLVMLLNAPARNFVGVLDAKRRKEGGE
jgi:large subunit ribosomal protein L10